MIKDEEESSFSSDGVNDNIAVRPVISLKVSTKTSSGTGTSEDPYVVN